MLALLHSICEGACLSSS